MIITCLSRINFTHPFLRSCEFTVASGARLDPEAHLALGDLSFDTLPNPSMALLRIKQSKTDPFRRGHKVVLGGRIRIYARWRRC